MVAWAHQGNALVPPNILLPGSANHPAFRQALTDLQGWKPSDLPKGTTGHGDPVRRWFINRLLEEFYYSFALPPSLGAIRDVLRLVWANIDDKTIRVYVINERTLSLAKEKANTRRQFDNTAKSVTHVAINRATVQARTPK